MAKSDLPNGSQFSPVQVNLPELLAMVSQYQPDRRAVQQAILERFFPDRIQQTTWDWKLADNTVLAMSEYGLIDKPRGGTTVELTALGRSLLDLANQGELVELYDEFARHILLNKRGLDLLTAAEDIRQSGVTPTKDRIVRELGNRGIYHPPNGTHSNAMRQWLELARVVDEDQWVANPDQLRRLLGGPDMAVLDDYAGLNPEQRAFAKAFARLNVDEAQSNKVAAYAAELFNVEFPAGGLPQAVLFPLRDAGLIEVLKTTGGGGAKPYLVRPTAQLRNELIEPMLDALEQSIGVQYRELIRMRYDDILAGLKGPEKYEKGRALEALSFFLGRLLRLEFVEWRVRSSQTGGAEIDVVMEGAHLVFSRWQIQCKNASQASLDDIAKEVGVAQVIKSNVILIVTTGRIGPAARQFAEKVMRETNLYIALLDEADLKRLRQSPANIAEIMEAQARGAMTIKKGQVTL